MGYNRRHLSEVSFDSLCLLKCECVVRVKSKGRDYYRYVVLLESCCPDWRVVPNAGRPPCEMRFSCRELPFEYLVTPLDALALELYERFR